MPDTIRIENAKIDEATVHRVELLDRVAVGPARVASVEAKQMALVLEPGGLQLRGVRAYVELHPIVEFGVNPKGPWKWDRTWELPAAILPALPLPDLTIPPPPAGFRLDASLGNLRLADGVEATLDPILAAQVPTLLASLVIEQIAASSISLPTGGFDLTGLRIDELVLRGLAMPGLTLGQTTIGRAHSEGTIRLPRLLLRGLQLPRRGAGDLDLTGFELRVDLDKVPEVGHEFKSDALDLYAKVRLRHDDDVKSFVRITVDALRLSDVRISGTIEALELLGLELGFDARGLRVGPMEARGVKAEEARLVRNP